MEVALGTLALHQTTEVEQLRQIRHSTEVVSQGHYPMWPGRVMHLKPHWPTLQTAKVQGRMGHRATRQVLAHYSMLPSLVNQARWPMWQAEEVLGSQAQWPIAEQANQAYRTSPEVAQVSLAQWSTSQTTETARAAVAQAVVDQTPQPN